MYWLHARTLEEGRAALRRAIDEDNASALAAMLATRRYSALVNDGRHMDDFETPAIVRAARDGRERCLRTLLALPFLDVNAHNMIGESALYRAIRHGHTTCARLLIEHARVDVSDTVHVPLHGAVVYDRPECAAMLLAHKDIDIARTNDRGENFVYFCGIYGRRQVRRREH